MERTEFQREYVILEERDGNYRGSGDKATGFIKVEGNGQTGKITCKVQGLKSGDGLAYGLYLIRSGDTDINPLKIGGVCVTGEKGEAVCRLDEIGIGQIIGDFDGFAVIAEERDAGDGTKAVCPLAGFKKGVRDGENKVLRLLEKLNEGCCDMGISDSTKEPCPQTEDEVTEDDKSGTGAETKDEPAEKEIPGIMEYHAPEHEVGMGYSCDQCMGFQDMAEKARQTMSQGNDTGIVDRLKSGFSMYFPEYEPFERKNVRYKWWKVANLVYLSNILYVNNVRTSLLYSPIVMMSHYKYRYIIIGIYRSRKQNEYIVCGIPSTYGADRRPFGELSRWIPVRYKRPTAGDFGYWVVYIDPKTGEFVN